MHHQPRSTIHWQEGKQLKPRAQHIWNSQKIIKIATILIYTVSIILTNFLLLFSIRRKLLSEYSYCTRWGQVLQTDEQTDRRTVEATKASEKKHPPGFFSSLPPLLILIDSNIALFLRSGI